ncbi:outer membrane protein assembly factor BamB family protein [Flavicella sediminum]|uniref:outer membrane protein assembly factor BamB family protein n=1 Tax=Flavicella sediminum TaxID=2585141 RepID=UPI00111CA729|nr:PQQ-binding-like beta-propeller repeat protein [Flavicella sediminum]
MMKLKSNSVLICLLSSILFVACNFSKESSVKVADSENQWPMSGGPDGSWKVNTNLEVPTKWSVRTGENIKWKQTLPEGGQSGIAVWGDQLFLTINPPTDSPKHAAVVAKFELAKTDYEALYAKEEAKLQKKGDRKYKSLKKAIATPEKIWKEVLKKHAHYQAASELEKPSIEANMMRRDKRGKAYADVNNALKTFIHHKSEELRTAYKVLESLKKAVKGGAASTDIQLLCLNANTGQIAWTRTVKGTISSEYNYGFSDATTPCPMTDGTYVWAINASGGMACFTMDGAPVWDRTWKPTTGGKPFNKQFDSMLFENLILNTEPPVRGDSTRNIDWNYLHAFNKLTGERIWVTKEALTHYNTPIIGETAEGKPAVLIGRGGPHGVPERPVGLSLISLEKNKQGTALWSWEPEEKNSISGWGALSTQHWDSKKASWFYSGDDHLTVDTQTGKLISQLNLTKVNQYNFDKTKQQHVLKENVEIKHLQNQRHCNISAGDDLFFMVRYQPYIARHSTLTGKNEHIEVPQEIDADGKYIWAQAQKNDGLNAQGQLHAFDARTRGDGFQKCFLGSPTMVNNYVFFTNAIGLVYVIDASADVLDANALVAVNDLGKQGETWTVNSMTYANGHIYHRTMKEIICIGK